LTSGRSRSHWAIFNALACCRSRRVASVRKPRSARKHSSADAVIPMSVHIRCSAGNVAALATMTPSSTSEWPAIYLVAACTETSTPWSNARKKSGVAQVLSITTSALRACATAAIAETSCTSKVSEPGDSTKTSFVLARNSRSIAEPTSGS
jgi:hypothetical protein